MNQILAPERTATAKRPWGWVALVLALAPVVVVLGGIPLHDPTCSYARCWSSPRERWLREGLDYVVLGIALGVFIVTVARLGPWLRSRPGLVQVLSIAALCILVPVSCFFAVVMVVVWNTECSESSWMCFGGPAAGVVLGPPGIVTALVSVLLAVGLARRRPADRADYSLSTVMVTGLGAALAAVPSGLLVNALTDRIADVLFR